MRRHGGVGVLVPNTSRPFSLIRTASRPGSALPSACQIGTAASVKEKMLGECRRNLLSLACTCLAPCMYPPLRTDPGQLQRCGTRWLCRATWECLSAPHLFLPLQLYADKPENPAANVRVR